MKNWGKPYFDMMDGILTQAWPSKGIEIPGRHRIHLKSNAKSWVGAVGPWQFMPETARNFGLRVNS